MATKTAKFKKKINGVVYDLNIPADNVIVTENETITSLSETISILKNEIIELKQRISSIENNN